VLCIKRAVEESLLALHVARISSQFESSVEREANVRRKLLSFDVTLGQLLDYHGLTLNCKFIHISIDCICFDSTQYVQSTEMSYLKISVFQRY